MDLPLPGGFGPGNAEKPRPGDWYCPICRDLQFARNPNCRRCGAQKPLPYNLGPQASAYYPMGGMGAVSSAPQAMLSGDWICPSCQDLVFARNNQCRRCGTARPVDGAGTSPGAAAGTSASGSPTALPSTTTLALPAAGCPQGQQPPPPGYPPGAAAALSYPVGAAAHPAAAGAWCAAAGTPSAYPGYPPGAGYYPPGWAMYPGYPFPGMAVTAPPSGGSGSGAAAVGGSSSSSSSRSNSTSSHGSSPQQ